jgi:hypothetical protein
MKELFRLVNRDKFDPISWLITLSMISLRVGWLNFTRSNQKTKTIFSVDWKSKRLNIVLIKCSRFQPFKHLRSTVWNGKLVSYHIVHVANFFLTFFLWLSAGWYTLHCLRNSEYFIIFFTTYIYIGSRLWPIVTFKYFQSTEKEDFWWVLIY